jgi:hypothetical protein
MEVIGIRKVEYVSKKTGKQVSGQELQLGFKDKDTEGVAVKTLYMSDKLMSETPEIKVGYKVRPLYNERGWVDSIEVQPK